LERYIEAHNPDVTDVNGDITALRAVNVRTID